jgi:hypothetical protein
MSQTVGSSAETTAIDATAPVQNQSSGKIGKRGRKGREALGRKANGKSEPARLPSVNLLSPWVFEAIALRRLRRRFAISAIVLLLLVAGAWAGQHLRIQQAEKALEVEQAETARLTAETNELAPVRDFVSGVERQMLTVKETMATEIYFSRVFQGLQRDTPAGAEITSLQVTLAPAPLPVAEGQEPIPVVSACPGPDPFNTKVVVGCITISGSADTRKDVGDFVIALGADDLFVEPFISTTTTADDSEVTFSGSVGLSEKVFSGRYADLEQLLGTGAN